MPNKKTQLVFVRDWLDSLHQVISTAEPVKMKDLEPHTGNMWCSSRVHLISSSQNTLLPTWIKRNTYSTSIRVHLKKKKSNKVSEKNFKHWKTKHFISFYSRFDFSVYSKFCFIVTFHLPLSLLHIFSLLAAMVWCWEAWPQEGVERHKWDNASLILTFMKLSVTSTMNVSMLELWHNKHSWNYTADYTERGSSVWSYHGSAPQPNSR